MALRSRGSGHDGPFEGLGYYTVADSEWFFGRDAERKTIIGNLRASRLTLLYAESGVGKSSLLRAGVAARLGTLAERNLAARGSPKDLPVVFSSWRDDPVDDLIGEIERSVRALDPRYADLSLPRDRLDAAITTVTDAVDATLLIILDQFEEYFVYRLRERRPGLLADELARAVNDPAVRANFLISIREDAYAGLGDLFGGQITNVYANYLHLEYLDREAARDAIQKPIDHFNEQHAGEQPVGIEPELVEAVLDEVRRSEAVAGRDGATSTDRDAIETPFLQLVMTRVWDREREAGSRTLRLATLHQLGTAQEILRAHLDAALVELTDDELETATDIFHQLVTPSGAKIAHSVGDLAMMTHRSAPAVAGVLTKLDRQDTRILRHLEPAPGTGDARYEIFHDKLAKPLLDWVGERDKERLRREARTQRRRANSFRALACLAILLGIGAAIFWRVSVAAQHTAQSQRLAAEAIDSLGSDPQLSTLLALAALHTSRTPQAEAALRTALPLPQPSRILRPEASVTSAAYSGDGKLIATAESDGVARLWDAGSHQELAVLGQPGQPLNSAAFSPDGKQVVTAGQDGTARIWDATTDRQVGGVIVEPGSQALASATFSPDGRRIVTASYDGTARIWEARGTSHAPLATLGRPSPTLFLSSAAFSPDGKRIVTAGNDGSATVWKAVGPAGGRWVGEKIYTPKRRGALSASFSPNGRLIIATSLDGYARVWDARDGAHTFRGAMSGPGPSWMTSASFSPDATMIVTASSAGEARIWNATTFKEIGAPLVGSARGALNAAAFAPGGDRVLLAGADGTAAIWSAGRTGYRRLAVLDGHGISRLGRAAFRADGKLVAAAGDDGTASIWRLADGARLAVVAPPGRPKIADLAFVPQNPTHLLTACDDGTIWEWNIITGAGSPLPPPDRRANGNLISVNSVSFATHGPDLEFVATAGGTATVYRYTSTGFSPFGAPVASSSQIDDASLSSDGSRLVTAASDGTAQIWDASARRHRPLGSFREPSGAGFETATYDPTGAEVLTASDDGTARIWSASKPNAELGSALVEPGEGILRDAEFSRDGSQVLTASTDGLARIWSADSRRLLLSLAGHTGRVVSGAFGPARGDGEVATSSSDGTLRIWRARPAQQLGNALTMAQDYSSVNAAVFSRKGDVVLTARQDGTARIWDWRSDRQLRRLGKASADGLTGAAFSPDGALIAAASADGTVHLWDAVSYAPRPSIGSPSTDPLNAARFAPQNGRLVVTASGDGNAYVWQSKDPTSAWTLASPPLPEPAGRAILDATFSPNGRRIATASIDGTARIWSWSPGRGGTEPLVLSEPGGDTLNSIAFSPDGKAVVTASNDGTARVWNATTGRLEDTLVESGHGVLNAAVFGRDGRTVLTSSTDGAARIWDWVGRRVLTAFPVGNTTYGASFAPGGGEVVTAGSFGIAQIWSTKLAGPLDAVERLAQRQDTRRLTPSERSEYGVG